MTMWEYHNRFFEQDGGTDEQLNKLGEQGWELVAVILDHTESQIPICCYYFKRLLQ